MSQLRYNSQRSRMASISIPYKVVEELANSLLKLCIPQTKFYDDFSRLMRPLILSIFSFDETIITCNATQKFLQSA
jgi:hypothetical protein